MGTVTNFARRHGVALLALFVALGGTSYAAIKLPAASVGTKQLKNSAVTLPKVSASLRQKLSAAGQGGGPGAQGPQGPKGDTGATGPQGERGLQGIPGTNGTN